MRARGKRTPRSRGDRRTEFESVFGHAPVNRLFGYRIVSRGRGRAAIAMRPRAAWIQQRGWIQGGVVAALADTAAMAALLPMLGAGETTATVEFKLNFLRPATLAGGELRAHSRLLNRGSQVAVIDAAVRQQRKLLARGLFTYLVYPARDGRSLAPRQAGSSAKRG